MMPKIDQTVGGGREGGREEEESFRCTSPDRAVRLAAAIPITRPVQRGTIAAIILRKQRRQEPVSGEGCPDRDRIQKVHLPADGHRSSLDRSWMRSFSTTRVSDLSVQAVNDISVFPSNLAALRAILKQFYTSRSVGSG